MKKITQVKPLLLSAVLLMIFSRFLPAADMPVWTFNGAKWYSLMETGNLMTGTETGVVMLDGATGTPIWSREDLKGIKEDEFHELSGTPFLLFTDNSGFFARKTKFFAVDTLTGKTVWETEKMQGFTVNVSPNYNKDLLIILTIQDNRLNKDKPDIYAFKLSTGDLLWKAEYTEKVDLYGVMRKGRTGTSAMLFGSGNTSSNRFDLSGENAPLFDGDSMYLTYAGLHRYNLADGKIVWKNVYDVTDGALKNTNGQAIIENDVIYTSAKGIIRAINKADGSIKWQTKDYGKGGIAEMITFGDTLYGRMGGQFFESKKGEYQKKNPIGVVALNKINGNEIWIYKDAKESITNMVILPEDNALLIGDEKNLIGLDLGNQGKVKESYKIPLKFKFNLGAAGVAAKAMKIGFGGIRGALAKSDTTDEPIALIRQENGTVVARGKQHLLAFNPKSKEIFWSTKYAAPSVSGWQTAVMTTLTALTVALQQGNKEMYAAQGDWGSAYKENSALIATLNSYHNYMVKRTSATKQSGNNIYVLTDLKGKDDKGKDDKGAGLIGVNLLTGQGISQIMFKDKEPDYEVDETAGRLFNLKDKIISAYLISEKTETSPSEEKEK